MSRNHIVGRVGELPMERALRRELLDAVQSRVGRVDIAGAVEGDELRPGEAAADRLAAAELARPAAVPAESEATLAFAGLADLFEGWRDLFELLPAPQLAALEVALLRAEPVGLPPDPRAVYAAALTVFREAATQGPVLIAIDDAQWLDRSTTEALAFALRRLTDEPIGWLLAVRGSATTIPLGLGRALPEEHVGRLSIEPLSVDELAELVRARLDTSFPPAILHSMHETSGGNPFFALEIARATLRGDTRATGQALPIPRNLRDDLVRDRVGTLPSFVQELLLYASASARPTVALLEAALERSPIDAPLADAVDAASWSETAGRSRSRTPSTAGDLCRELPGAPPSGPSSLERGGGRRRGARPASGVGGGRSGRGCRDRAGGRSGTARARGSTAAAASSASWPSVSRHRPGRRRRRLRGAAASTTCSPATTTRRSRSSSLSCPSLRQDRSGGGAPPTGAALVIRDDDRRAVDVLTQALGRSHLRRYPELAPCVALDRARVSWRSAGRPA
jgi:hypothetical protein